MPAQDPVFLADPDNDIDKKTMINTYLYFNSLIEDCADFSAELTTFLDLIIANLNFRYRKNCQKFCIMLIQKILTKKTISPNNTNAIKAIITFLNNYISSHLPQPDVTIPLEVRNHTNLEQYVKFTSSFIFYCLNNKKISDPITEIDPDANNFFEIYNTFLPYLNTEELKMGVQIGQTGGLKKDNKKIIKKNPIKKDNKKPKEKSKKK